MRWIALVTHVVLGTCTGLAAGATNAVLAWGALMLDAIRAETTGPTLASDEYARDLNEVKALGAQNSVVRTPEQGEIAVFWSDFAYTAMPPGHWHEIAATVLPWIGTAAWSSAPGSWPC